MKEADAAKLFESLSSETRLGIYRLLVRQGATGMVAGDIARHFDIPPSSLSFHLKELSHAGLLSSVQEGRFLRYRADLPLMLELVAFLSRECCADQAACLAPAPHCP